jgi:hypothetical protein
VLEADARTIAEITVPQIRELKLNLLKQLSSACEAERPMPQPHEGNDPPSLSRQPSKRQLRFTRSRRVINRGSESR